jgi:hypothetical protein
MVPDWSEVDAVDQEDVANTKAIKEDQLMTAAKNFERDKANIQAAINTHQKEGSG